MINLEITERYRKENNLANVYGFILFTNSNSNVIKVLGDNNYWNGFDEDSEGWMIFSIKPEIGKMNFPKFPPGMMGLMIPIWEEPSKNRNMLDFFDLTSTKNIMPCMILFAIDSTNSIQKTIYPLKDNTIDEARNSIKSIIIDVSKVIKNILPKYKDSDSVIREVIKETESKILWENVSNAATKISFLKSFT